VMYLLDAEDDRIPDLKAALARLGDSLVVVGGDGLWNVHVHVDDVGATIEAGLEAGRPHRVRVTHFAEQVAAARERPGSTRTGRRIVAVAAGPGLHALFEGAGAVVVDGGPGDRPSTGMLLEAITACGAAEVVVLPNDPDSVRVAEIAARTAETDHGVRVAVIPTQAQVQGLAALAVHEPGRSFDQDVLEMTATARHARHGAVISRTSWSKLRPGSWTARAASPCTWARVGITTARMPSSVPAVPAAIWATRTESPSLGRITTSPAPVARIASSTSRVLGRRPGPPRPTTASGRL